MQKHTLNEDFSMIFSSKFDPNIDKQIIPPNQQTQFYSVIMESSAKKK